MHMKSYHKGSNLSNARYTQDVKQNTAEDAHSELLFTIDRKGDPSNVKYGSLDQYKIPQYRAAGSGRLIGLNRRFRISYLPGSVRNIENDENSDSVRKNRHSILTRGSFYQDDRDDCQLIKVGFNYDTIQEADYISLMPTDWQEHDSNLSLTHEESSDQRQYGDSASGIGFNDEAFERFRNHPVNKKNVELSRAVERNPQDIKSWMALIDHQEEFFLLSSLSDRDHLPIASRSAIVEMRIALYEKALRNVNDTVQNVELIGGLMKEGSKIWDTDRQVKEWKRILQGTKLLALRIDYISFEQKASVLFSFERCLDLYLKILQDAQESQGTVRCLSYLALRLTMYMRQAGYVERAIALWQGLIEINIFSPISVTSGNIIMSFGEFWGGEMARVGEDGGKGWGNSSASPMQLQPAKSITHPEVNDFFRGWISTEDALSHMHCMPARATSTEMEDDPYHTILFADIEPFLFHVQEDQEKKSLVQALLHFCGLPPIQKTDDVDDRWHNDALLLSPCELADHLELKHMVTDSSTLTAPIGTCFNCFSGRILSSSPILKFILLVLLELVDKLHEDDHIAVYTIALKFAVEPVTARKYAKSLLKKRSNRPRLYNAYALLEAGSGNINVAENVWSTAILMAASFSTNLQQQVIVLWQNWIWFLLEQKQFDRAMKLMINVLPHRSSDTDAFAIPGDQPKPTIEEILIAKQYLNDQLTTSIQAHNIDETLASTDLLAILNYLLNNHDLNEVIRTYETSQTAFENGSNIYMNERLHQSRARLIDLHARQSPTGYRPVQVINALKRSITSFPNNSIFHYLYETYSRRAGLIDRLRTIETTSQQVEGASKSEATIAATRNEDEHCQHINRESNVMLTILELSTELSRPLYSGSTPHSIRAAFTRATSIDNPARHSPWIWMKWLNWEISLLKQSPSSFQSTITSTSTVEIPRQTAKRLEDIYFSSLRACPWVKELYLFGFRSRTMRDVIGEEGLENVYLSMIDRGLRVRVDIEQEINERRQRRLQMD